MKPANSISMAGAPSIQARDGLRATLARKAEDWSISIDDRHQHVGMRSSDDPDPPYSGSRPFIGRFGLQLLSLVTIGETLFYGLLSNQQYCAMH